VNDPDVNQLLFRLYEKVTFEGALAIRYPDDSELLSYLRDIDDERLRRDFRRNPSLDLGGYDLTAFRKFFSSSLFWSQYARFMSGCAERGRKTADVIRLSQLC